jgi:ribokinase
MREVLEVVHVLLLNREEAHKLVGGDKNDTKALQQKLHERGPKKVIITDARNGTFAYDSENDQYLWAGIPEESPVVERTGAGDAFSTGCISALAKGMELSEALVWGTLSSTSVVQYIGAREGLLTPQKMAEMKEKWVKDFEVKEF